ncbi:hypothetical protein V5F79_00210 [Xanthobacter flavus]|uniref:hypothetical protein n=1 Tax=Xanthobacter flavus TaxID=281 RepID=UPI00372AE782
MQFHRKSPNRETDSAYSGVIAQLGVRARVAICPDHLQYIVQVRDGAAWRARRFFATRSALLTQLAEVVGDVAPDAMARLARLPAFAADYTDEPSPYESREVGA